MLRVERLARSGLEPVSFALNDGECIAVRGPSGSGKTLLLRALADLDPVEGAMSLDGIAHIAMPAPEWRRSVAYLPAEPGWWDQTVGAHFPDPSGTKPFLEQLGLPSACLDWPITQLSTGERQRLGLIRVLLLDPRVYLLDEPTSGLDEAATATVETLIAERLAAGAASIWVTHDAGQAARIATRQLSVEDGHVRENHGRAPA